MHKHSPNFRHSLIIQYPPSNENIPTPFPLSLPLIFQNKIYRIPSNIFFTHLLTILNLNLYQTYQIPLSPSKFYINNFPLFPTEPLILHPTNTLC